MKQQLKFSPTLSDMAFPMIEVDADTVTVKMFIDVFKGEDGPVDPAATPPISHFYANNCSEHYVMQRHNVRINEGDTYDIFNGDIWPDDLNKQGRWFKFVGGAQIKRNADKTGIKLLTTVFDRNEESPDEGFEIGPNMPEWQDCSMWAFDYSFAGQNFYTPYNLFLETKASHSTGYRYEARRNFVYKPVITVMQEGKTYYSTSEHQKRVVGMFLFDKDDAFTNASFYVKTWGKPLYQKTETGWTASELEQAEDAFNTFYKPEGTFSKYYRQDHTLLNYQTLPTPTIYVNIPETINRDDIVKGNVSLLDLDDVLLMEDGDILITEGMDESSISLLRQVDESLQVDGEPESSKILNKDVSVYVKSNMGYLGKNKIELINGKGSFYFRALDLEVDDEVKLKIGFKTFSNVTEQNIKVILGA
tara:strand:- start:5244 stop:6497 length:1254 start_codon:yes stop_codon:yes gene_type:complete